MKPKDLIFEDKKYLFIITFKSFNAILEIFNKRTLIPISLGDYQKEKKRERTKRKEKKKAPSGKKKISKLPDPTTVLTFYRAEVKSQK
jgi:hypothetical protein